MPLRLVPRSPVSKALAVARRQSIITNAAVTTAASDAAAQSEAVAAIDAGAISETLTALNERLNLVEDEVFP
jgi:hypothetical protein